MRIPKPAVVISIALLSCLFTSCSTPDNNKRNVVNEGLYINEIYASGEDWIELYNDLGTSVDISGYSISDNTTTKYKIPAGTNISAKGYLILICNGLGTGLNTDFKLSSSGESIYLENASGTLIDQVDFPALNNGQSYGRYPDGSSTLAISGNTTKGITNGDSQAPAIVSVSRLPLVPALNQTVTVTATLVSNTDVASVKLFYRFNGGVYSSVNMTLSGTSYTATLPAQSATGVVEYYVEAKGTNNKVTYKPATAPANVLNYLLNTDPLPQLVINEFLAFNTSCCPDVEAGINEYDDWIEIYNKGSVAVDIGGMYLSDDLTNPFNFRIPGDSPSTTTIQPGGYLLLWADNSPSQGPLHLDFGLSNTGESIGLYYIDGRAIDTYTFGAQSENLSFGRTTDGAATWKVFNTPTPGHSN